MKRKNPTKFVTVNNTTYGKALKGIKIYYEGPKPTTLSKDGKITFGKGILELLKTKFKKFQWIITQNDDSIELSYGIYRVRTSKRTLDKMYKDSFAITKDIKTDIINNQFAIIYPTVFDKASRKPYISGAIANILSPGILSMLSATDRDSLNKFIPEYIAAEAAASVNTLNAVAQIKTLKGIAKELKDAINADYSEGWWQKYIKNNILIIQQGYIKALEKINTSIGTIKFPDFSLITHDSFLDILEIKRPGTPLLKLDTSRGNYYWEPDVSKALIQTENYIENVSKHADSVRSYILDTHNINLKVVRPRGIILAGDARKFGEQKQKDDFRLLTQASKNIIFLTYDELLSRLENYIKVLEEYSHAAPVK